MTKVARAVVMGTMVLVIGGCTPQPLPNRWQYQSTNGYKNFERYYLEDKTLYAAVEFDRARAYASQSADLTTLARIELSRCALKAGMLEPFECKEYVLLDPLVADRELEAYHAFLSRSITQEWVSSLPPQYREIASLYVKGEFKEADRTLLAIEPLTSRLIAASVMAEKLDDATIEQIVADASYHGYKRAVIVWLGLLIERTKEEQRKNLLIQKREILLRSR